MKKKDPWKSEMDQLWVENLVNKGNNNKMLGNLEKLFECFLKKIREKSKQETPSQSVVPAFANPALIDLQ